MEPKFLRSLIIIFINLNLAYLFWSLVIRLLKKFKKTRRFYEFCKRNRRKIYLIVYVSGSILLVMLHTYLNR
ncbi:MAG: hypothetical protein GY863_05020 [bacterium]|nr:hypothetical protein [bacterium]